METLVRLAGVVIAALGLAYLAVPRRVYHFGFEFLRDADSEGTEPSKTVIWLYRFIGVCLVVMSASYLS